MKKLIAILIILPCTLFTYSQGPWDNDLQIAFSNDGTTFTGSTFLLDSADVPSIALLDDGTLMASFQWFEGNPNGKVATMTSSDNGLTWSSPTLVTFINQPSGLFKPVDPTIVNIGGGQTRMYFSIGENMITDSTLDVFSATSSDGLNYTFDSSVAAYSDSIEIIEPAVQNINGTWHCVYAIGHPWLGASHASSTNGLNFNMAAHINSDTAHSWIGNFMDDGGLTRFYGSTPNEVWWASTSDGVSYGPYNATNIDGTNPAVTKLSNGTYVIVYVEKNAPPLSIHDGRIQANLFPNPSRTFFKIQTNAVLSNAKLIVFNALGQQVLVENNISGSTVTVQRGNLENGIYLVNLLQDDQLIFSEKVLFEDF